MTTKSRKGLIRNQDDIPAYIPPGHEGTVNIRLVEKDFCGAFEMNLGTVQPGGEASPHFHDNEYQVIYVLEGVAEVVLGDDAPVDCGPGAVIEIPPKLRHAVYVKGAKPLKALILYSPPLPPREEIAVGNGDVG